MRRRSFLITLAIAVAILRLGRAAAEPQLHVADLVPFTLRGDPTARLSLLVYGGAPLFGLRAEVKQLKDPDGQSLPQTLLETAVETPQVTEQGSRVYLRPDYDGFRRPGDYLAVLLLTASSAGPGQRPLPTQPVSLLVPLTLRRERPSVHAEPLSVRLIRPAPWRPARLQVPYFIENRGPRALRELSIDAQPMAVAQPQGAGRPEGMLELAPGSLTVVPPPPPAGQVLQRQRSGQAMELLPNGRLDLTLLLSDLSEVGRFQTGLTLRGPDLGAPQIVPIAVEVSDRWEFALVAVALGVLTSALFYRLSGRFRKSAENHYRIAHLAHELEGLAATGSSGWAARAAFSEKLRRASQRNSDGEATLGGQLLDELEAELDAFYGKENELRATVLDAAATGRGLRIEVHEPPGRWRVGTALRLRAVDERPLEERGADEKYLWQFRDGPAEPGAQEVEYPLDKPGEANLQVFIRRTDGTEAAAARRCLPVMAARPAVDLGAAAHPRLRVQYVLTLISLPLCGLSGVYLLCYSAALKPVLGASFGTPVSYIAGVAWGLGLDLLLRGFSDLLLRLASDR